MAMENPNFGDAKGEIYFIYFAISLYFGVFLALFFFITSKLRFPLYTLNSAIFAENPQRGGLWALMLLLRKKYKLYHLATYVIMRNKTLAFKCI